MFWALLSDWLRSVTISFSADSNFLISPRIGLKLLAPPVKIPSFLYKSPFKVMHVNLWIGLSQATFFAISLSSAMKVYPNISAIALLNFSSNFNTFIASSTFPSSIFLSLSTVSFSTILLLTLLRGIKLSCPLKEFESSKSLEIVCV
jgi:hypothetical protein